MMARASLTFAMRPFLIEDAPLLAEMFRASIEELTADDYSEGQQEAWASAADDEEEFARRLEGQLTLIATMNSSPVGFASLANNETSSMRSARPEPRLRREREPPTSFVFRTNGSSMASSIAR